MSTTVAPPLSASFPAARLLRTIAPIAILIVYAGVLFFVQLGGRDLTSSHEARAAQNAQMILDEGHWLVPQLFDKHVELQKPPLYYWLVALIGWLNGGVVNAWAVRLPAALSALACVLFLYVLGIKSGRPRAGLLAAFILASCIHFTWLARIGRIDMPLTAAVTIALGSFYLGTRQDISRFGWHLLGYASLGIGLLLKGPIALVLVCIVLATTWLFRGRRPALRSNTLWWGMPLTLAIAAPWYIAANVQTDGQLLEVFFWHHNVERGLGGSESLKSYPWWYYGPQLAFDLLPWSIAAPIAVFLFLRDSRYRTDVEAFLGLCWFVSVTAFLSCMSFKRADYLIPAFPGMAIFLGAILDRWQTVHATNSKRATVGFMGILGLYAVSWLAYSRVSAETEWPYREVAQEIRGRTKGPVIFFRAETHVLMYHLGRPVGTILEWENLEWWVNFPRPVYVVMPEKCADEWRTRLPAGSLEEVLRTRDFVDGHRDRPLVVLRTPSRLASNP